MKTRILLALVAVALSSCVNGPYGSAIAPILNSYGVGYSEYGGWSGYVGGGGGYYNPPYVPTYHGGNYYNYDGGHCEDPYGHLRNYVPSYDGYTQRYRH